ncbi:MAG TPA: hypothetical protein VKE94_06685 [Gemmataceae bacterium]|nr:hypothetical protein [Gemmataceae bacterium]
MSFGRRFLAAVALLTCAALLLLSLVAGVGVWIVKRPVTAKATRVFERVEAALDIARQNLAQGKASLARAAERLESARGEQRKLTQEQPSNSALRRTLARTVQRTVAPEIGDAQQKLHAVAEAAVVVNAVLEDVGNFPLASISGLDLERLNEMNARLADVGPAAWELGRLLGEQAQEPGAEGNQFSRVEQSIQTLQELIVQYEPRLTEARQRMEEMKSKLLRWITPATALVSALCFWIALSQVSLAFHVCRWWKRSTPDKLTASPT